MKSNNSKRVARIMVFVDMLLLITLVLLTMINPPIDPTVELRPQAMLIVEWDDKALSDVDTHVVLPNSEHVSYIYKDAGGRVVLTRDDTGASLDHRGNNIDINVEVTEFFVLEPGEYKVWVRLFSQRDEYPISVTIRFQTLSPFERWVDRMVVLEHRTQTIAIASIHVDNEGNITFVDTDVDYRLPGRTRP